MANIKYKALMFDDDWSVEEFNTLLKPAEDLVETNNFMLKFLEKHRVKGKGSKKITAKISYKEMSLIIATLIKKYNESFLEEMKALQNL